jgi:hypothetical protein
VDGILARPGVALSLDFRPGDLQLLNNTTVWHSRTGFSDFDDPRLARLLLRLWISPPNSRRLGPSFAPLYGDTRPWGAAAAGARWSRVASVGGLDRGEIEPTPRRSAMKRVNRKLQLLANAATIVIAALRLP